MSGSSTARLPGRLLPSQHQSAGVRHDGLHRLETRPGSQGGSSEVGHTVSGQRGWVHVQPNVPNQARAASLGETWPNDCDHALKKINKCRFTLLYFPNQADNDPKQPSYHTTEPVNPKVIIIKIKGLQSWLQSQLFYLWFYQSGPILTFINEHSWRI